MTILNPLEEMRAAKLAEAKGDNTETVVEHAVAVRDAATTGEPSEEMKAVAEAAALHEQAPVDPAPSTGAEVKDPAPAGAGKKTADTNQGQADDNQGSAAAAKDQ